jgi:hypothetical protein
MPTAKAGPRLPSPHSRRQCGRSFRYRWGLQSQQARPDVALAARYALPTIYENRESVAAGGLMRYGTNVPDAQRQHLCARHLPEGRTSCSPMPSRPGISTRKTMRPAEDLEPIANLKKSKNGPSSSGWPFQIGSCRSARRLSLMGAGLFFHHLCRAQTGVQRLNLSRFVPTGRGSDLLE